jgi:multidrug resistance efflux pump
MTNHGNGPEATVAASPSRATPPSLSDRVRSLRLDKPDAPSRSGRGSALPWILCGVLTVLLFASLGGLGYTLYSTERESSSLERSGNESVGRDSSTSTVASSGEVVLESKGYVIPVHQIKVSPKVGGMVTKLYIIEGQRVKENEVLAELETVDYQADYDHARATAANCWQKFLELYTGSRPEEIRQAKASLEEMDANKQRLFLDWKRSSRLQGDALAQKDYEQAEGDYRAMERRVVQMRSAYALMLEGPRIERIEAAWADVEQAEADLAKAKWRLDSCTIRAPISGTILSKTAEIGNIVNPLAFNISSAFCDMADLSDIEVDLAIQERDIAKVRKDQKCKARPSAYPDRVYDGFVSRIMPSADQSKGAVLVRAKLNVPREEEGVYLKPNMGVDVSFLKKPREQTAK